jgi:hypothetical protein
MMTETAGRERGCGRLAGAEHGLPEALGRLLRLWSWRGVARLPGRTLLLDRLLLRALRQAAACDGGFFVPVPLAEAALGSALWLEPSPASLKLRLTDWVRGAGTRLHIDTCFLGSGDWGAIAEPICDSPVFREARELIDCDFRYRQTEAYARYLTAIAENRPIRRNRIVLSDRQLVDSYFIRFVELFRSIEKNGLLRRRESSRGPWPAASATFRPFWTELGEKEIGVAVAADGEILRLPGGQHRTAIACALNLPRIPVQVRLLHADWLHRETAKKQLPPSAAIRYGIARLRG